MSSTTPNLDLVKLSGTDNFSNANALAGNWDKIDAFAGKITPKTKTVTGTTQSNGSINLNLPNATNYVVVAKDSNSVYRVQAIPVGSGWYGIVTTDAASPVAVANTSVSISVRYIEM